MKKGLLRAGLLVLLIGTMAFDQNSNNLTPLKTLDEIHPKKDIKIGSKKLFKNEKRVALFKTALHFKVISNGVAMVGKGMSQRNFATTWAILEGIESEDMQDITEAYYVMLRTKLENMGVEVVDFETIQQAATFEKLSDSDSKRDWSNKSIGAVSVHTAFNGPITPPVEGNIAHWSKLGKLSKELGATAMFVDLIIDFAVFDIDFHRKRGMNYTSTSATANVIPEITIKPYYGGETPPYGYSPMNSGISIVPRYGMQGTLNINKNTLFPGGFADEIESFSGQMPKSMKRWISIGNELDLTTGTFVVRANPAQYRERVLHALEQYTDALLAKWAENQ